MHKIFSKISSPMVYGPLTKEELDQISIPKTAVPESDGWYVGVNSEIPSLAEKKIFKWVPPVLEETPVETPTAEEPAVEEPTPDPEPPTE
jgi:hypothetical protein